MISTIRIALLPCLLLSLACYGGDEGRYAPPPEDAGETAAPAASASPASTTTPPDSPVPTNPTSPGDTAVGSLDFEFPEDWREVTPSSSMRMAQAALPGPGGDAELAVFFFGVGGGGGAEANIQRWIGQVEPTADPVRDSFETGDYQVTWVEVDGTLKGGQMGGPAEARPDSTLLGAVVEGPGGPWFFKITGPADTVEAQKDAFFGMLQSLG